MPRLALALCALAPLAACVDAADELDEAGDSAALMTGDPAHGALAAVDVSHWEGPLSQHEVDCFWTEGVRHLVAGTQVAEVTRQQLAMAVARGLTVDAYVYLTWDRDTAAQVEQAFTTAAGFPVGRMWLDVEEPPAGRSVATLTAAVERAATACRAHAGVDCGIYTGAGFWRSAMANTATFAELPLWFAWYDHDQRLDTWATQRFGGWQAPVAKQWAEEVLCGVGVDKDSMQVVSSPTVVVDRTPPPAPTAPPPAPTGAYPADGATVTVDYVKLMAGSLPGATSWQFALEQWDGAAWRTYYTWSATVPFRKVVPTYRDRYYRHRARAQNALGWGAWSAWSTFAYGAPTTPPPGANPPPPPPPPPPTSGVPTGLMPDGVTVTTAAVTLRWSAVTSATQYTVAIEYLVAGTWRAYTTYTTTTASKTFYPQTHGTTYRFRARARVGGVDGAWSTDASFTYP